MKELVLGTAGHIDHGKTSLIKALTGIETDRLKEEKARGITIELGFAHLDLPSGQHLGIVDVPGHEKFVKNMVAGAAGIDLVAMVIAADEGVMPQTREHLDICRLLGVQYGVVVLNKVDMVDEEWLELVADDVSSFVESSFLEDAAVVPVSSVTGQGLDELTAELDRLAVKITQRPAWGLFRLPVDRVFTMKGFGSVITGTCIGGSIEVGQEVTLFPQGPSARVRGLQVHGQEVNQAFRGQRTAMNLQGLEKSQIQRGQVVSTPGALRPSMWLDLELQVLPTAPRPIKHRAPIRLHTGSMESLGRVLLLDRDQLEPGQTALCQARLDEPVALVAGDRFVLRSYSPVTTVAGGMILHPHSKRHKRNRPAIMAELETLRSGAAAERISLHARLSGVKGVLPEDLPRLVPLAPKEQSKLLTELMNKRELVRIDKESGRMLNGQVLEDLLKQAMELVAGFHKAQPLKPGMPKEELRQRLGPDFEAKLFNQIVQRLSDGGGLVADRDIVHLSSHKVSLAADEAELKARIEKAYAEAGFTPPNLKDVIKDSDAKQAKQIVGVLMNQGVLVRIKGDLYYGAEPYSQIKERLVAYLKEHEKIDAPKFKELFGLSRKYMIPLLEHFDTIKLTMRVGDDRVLRGQG